MFWYTLIKTSELEDKDLYLATKEFIITEFEAVIKKQDLEIERLEKINHQQKLAIDSQAKTIQKFAKNIPHYWWLIGDIDKRATDKQLKNPKNPSLPEGITQDMIEHFIIDRKQGKIAILLK
jgi:hypothetical protein